jgi:hypothetical protein
MSEQKAVQVLDKIIIRCDGADDCMNPLKKTVIDVVNHFWEEEQEKYIKEGNNPNHIFLKLLELRDKLDFIEPIPGDIFVRNPDEKCQSCGEKQVPVYVTHDFRIDPRHVIPHVIYTTCKKCGHDNSSQSF